MNVFEEIKINVTTGQAAEIYGIQVNRRGIAVCPFHNTKYKTACGISGYLSCSLLYRIIFGASLGNQRGIFLL